MPDSFKPDSFTADDSFKPDSFTPDAAPEQSFLDSVLGYVPESVKTVGRRALFGPTAEEMGFEPGTRILGTPESEGSILPELPQPETYWGGFARSLYNDFIRPLGTPSG